MQVKDLMALLSKVPPETQVLMTCTNDDGLVGNKVIDDANVFGIVEDGVFYISNRNWDDAAS